MYISAKISSSENETPELFSKAAKELQAKGFETVNHMTLNNQLDKIEVVRDTVVEVDSKPISCSSTFKN